MTRYLVLKHEGKVWQPVATVEARGDKAAIQKAVEATKPPAEDEPAPEPQPGEYVAVPSRNWNPRKVGVDTKPTITIT